MSISSFCSRKLQKPEPEGIVSIFISNPSALKNHDFSLQRPLPRFALFSPPTNSAIKNLFTQEKFRIRSEQDIQKLELNQDIEGGSVSTGALEKDLKRAVIKAAATFAPRASTANKNPAVPGSTLYTVFEVQAYASMLLGGALSFNLIFPSNEPDIWRLMGMWSIWMFTVPSLRARDCSKKEKEALNYLFLLIPLLNVVIPFFWKSFAVVWSADTIAFFGMFAWKLGWLSQKE